MARVILHATAQPRAIHPDWMDAWCADIGDQALKTAIWNTARFDERISSDLLWDHFECASRIEPDFANRKQLDRVLDQADEAFFFDVGLKWLAPVLCAHLLDRATRAHIGDLSREQMKAVLAFQDHAAPEVVGTIPDGAAYGAQGVACLQAWLMCLPEPVSARVKLTFPPVDPAALHPQDARAALFDRILFEISDTGGLN